MDPFSKGLKKLVIHGAITYKMSGLASGASIVLPKLNQLQKEKPERSKVLQKLFFNRR